MGQYARTGQWIDCDNKWRFNQHTSADQTPISYIPVASPGLKPKGVGMKSGRSGALKTDKLGLSCKANKCSDAGTGDFDVLTIHETSSMEIPAGDAGSTRPGRLPLQVSCLHGEFHRLVKCKGKLHHVGHIKV